VTGDELYHLAIVTRTKPRTSSPSALSKRPPCSRPSPPGTSPCLRCLGPVLGVATEKQRRQSPESNRKRQRRICPHEPTAKKNGIGVSYPWQNYKGPLQQNWFELHDGLEEFAVHLSRTTKKGTVAFVGGSITGMPWRKKVMENLERNVSRIDRVQVHSCRGRFHRNDVWLVSTGSGRHSKREKSICCSKKQR
jgi:hypothetical protein